MKHLPNFLTCCNLLCGCLGVISVFEGNLIQASYLMWGGGIFDFFDGFAARLVKVSSELGKQLDSLADMITFGLLPGVIVFKLLEASLPIGEPLFFYLKYIALAIPLFSALRLAKFNIDERQSEDFIGLNTPANGIFFSSFPFILQDNVPLISSLIQDYRFLIVIALVFSLLLVSEIRIFGFKFKDYSFKTNQIRYIFLLSSIILLIIFKFTAIPLIIILYLTLSLVKQFLLDRK